MKKSIGINLVIISSLTFGLTGCGGGGDSAPDTNPNSQLTPTNIEVERGPVYEATVKDASGKIATQKNGKNIYTFSDTPIYPITVNGGWIDLNGDGTKDNNDIILDINMTSYSNIVTPITTLCSNSDKSKRDELEAKFAQELGVTILELKKLPSKALQKVAVLTNAIFKEVKENNATISKRFNYENIIEDTNHNNFTQLMSEYNSITTIAESSDAMTNGVFDSKKLEQYIINQNNNIFTTVGEKNDESTSATENNETNNSTTYDITWKSKGYNEITSPHTGKVWLDRNLGANKVCENYNDTECYGDYYQWGRLSDGHENINSDTTAIQPNNWDDLNNKFITSDWTTTKGDWAKNLDESGNLRKNTWLQTDGQSICPINFRVPTYIELKAETLDLNIQTNMDGYNGFLKIPSSGARERTSGYMGNYGIAGQLWSADTYIGTTPLSGTTSAISINMQTSDTTGYNIGTRAVAMAVRCIKDINTTNSASDNNQNINPIANAGVDQNITSGTSITLNASSSSDRDGTIASYQWKEENITLSNSSSFSKSNFTVGTHIVTLIVTDDDGATHSDNITITVNFPQHTEEILTFNSKTYKTVQSPNTGKIWLDRNLGANQVCLSFDDSECYGDYYQWGRLTDGHESNNSNLSETPATSIINNNNLFIKTTNTLYSDWVDKTNENVINPNIDGNGSLRNQNWNKVDGSTICPLGFRVPSIEELKRETIDIGIQKRDDIFNSFLKIPSAGNRFGGDGEFYFKENRVYLWSNSIHEEDYYKYSQYIYFEYTYGNSGFSSRADGKSIRCIKN